MLSELLFKDAHDLLEAQIDNVSLSEIKLLAVYNQYIWTKRGINLQL